MMNKDKETMAQDYVRSLTESGDVKFSYSFTRMINSYLAGFDAGQAQILEQASWYLSLSPADKKSFGDLIVELKQAKELIKEMRDVLRRVKSYNKSDGNPPIDHFGPDSMQYWKWQELISRQMSENYLEENTDKIKALLGEE
jgi:hypothetical protein